MENIFIIYGRSLKDARMGTKPKITQQAMADELGIDRTTYTQWEGKETLEIDKNQMKILEKTLNVTSDVLTKVPRGTSIEEHELYKTLAIERKERIAELRDQVTVLKKQLEECRAASTPRKKK